MCYNQISKSRSIDNWGLRFIVIPHNRVASSSSSIHWSFVVWLLLGISRLIKLFNKNNRDVFIASRKISPLFYEPTTDYICKDINILLNLDTLEGATLPRIYIAGLLELFFLLGLTCWGFARDGASLDRSSMDNYCSKERYLTLIASTKSSISARQMVS